MAKRSVDLSSSSSLLLMCVILGLLISEEAAATSKLSWWDCYRFCVERCPIGYKKMLFCSFKCLKKCLVPAHNLKDNRFFCELGCAVSNCTNFTSAKNDNPVEGKMEGCVDSCSSMCTKNYK